MIEVRCKGCNKFHLKAVVFVGAIKCSRCKMVFEYKIVTNLHVTDSFDILQAESIRDQLHNATTTPDKGGKV